jgi:peptide/nickel transport system permease protein
MSAHAARTGGAGGAMPRARHVLPTNLERGGSSVAATQTAPSESPNQLALRRLRENRLAQGAAVVFAALVLMCLSAGLFEKGWAHRGANQQNVDGTVDVGGRQVEVVDIHGIPQVGPGFRTSYTMGADPLGRDVFMRVLEGGQVSLLIGLGGALITIVLGTAIGAAAGYFGGRVDFVVSQVIDILLAFPTMVFAIALSTSLTSGSGNGFIHRGSVLLPLMIIGGLGSFYFARVIRSRAMDLAGRDFVEAARALGASHTRIVLHDIVPHLVPTIIAYSSVLVSADIIMEAALSFLGVGVLPPTASWGNLISDGRIFYATAWWVSMFPGLFIVITVVCLSIVGEALEDAFDPKSGGR